MLPIIGRGGGGGTGIILKGIGKKKGAVRLVFRGSGEKWEGEGKAFPKKKVLEAWRKKSTGWGSRQGGSLCRYHINIGLSLKFIKKSGGRTDREVFLLGGRGGRNYGEGNEAHILVSVGTEQKGQFIIHESGGQEGKQMKRVC